MRLLRRVRTSTWVLAVVFVAALVAYAKSARTGQSRRPRPGDGAARGLTHAQPVTVAGQAAADLPS